MRQVAPEPKLLAGLVDRLKYKAGWKFTLGDIDRGQGSEGLTLIILVTSPDSSQPEQTIRVNHYMIVPPAAFDERAWARWLFDQILLVEQHEAAEFFQIDGVKTFGPHHAPGENPYTIHEVGTVDDTRKNWRGELG